MLSILVFHCCIINYHKHSDLKQHTFISQFLWVWSPGLRLGLLFRVSAGCNQDVGQAVLFSVGLTKDKSTCRLSGCWQNLFPCICMTEGPNFSLAVHQRLPSGPRGCPQFPATYSLQK